MSQSHSASGGSHNWYNGTNILEDILPSSRPQTSDNWVFPPNTGEYTWIQDSPLETLVSDNDSTLSVSGSGSINTMSVLNDITNQGPPESDDHPETPGHIEPPVQNIDDGVAGYLSAQQAQDILGTDDWDPDNTVTFSRAVLDEATNEYVLTAPRTVHTLQYLHGDDYFSNLVLNSQEETSSIPMERGDAFSTNSADDSRSLSASYCPSVSMASTLDSPSDRAESVGSPDDELKDDAVDDDLNPDPDCIYRVSLVKGKRWYECKTCSIQGTYRRRDMLRHVQTRIHKDDRFPCIVCNRDFFSKGSLERHFDTKAHKYLVKKNGRYHLRTRADRK